VTDVPKRDYYDDPLAPAANSLVVAVGAVVRNESGGVLMIQRTDNGLWALPGGAQEIGETPSEAAVREIYEETGINTRVTGLVGIYSDPRHVIAYDDGEVRQEFSIVFYAQPIGGSPRTSSESSRVHWVTRAEIDSLQIHQSVQLRIQHALQDNPIPHLS
jgi:ADP-ribose pyrophosphatase YjhB (NUDIX family)